MKKIFDFTGKSKIFFGISIAIIVIGIICNVVFGVTLDIQFTGGTILQYNYIGEVDTDAMKELIQKETEDTVSFNIGDNITMAEDGTQLQDGYLLSVQFSGQKTITTEVMENLTAKLQESFPDNNVKMVDPSNWQGPVWGITSFLAAYGLNRYGYKQEAKEIANRMVSTFASDIKQNGCVHEYYHGDTGQP